jgi:hypothetical protein
MSKEAKEKHQKKKLKRLLWGRSSGIRGYLLAVDKHSNLLKEAPKEFMYSGTILVMAASRSGNEALVQGLLDCGAASPHTF